MLCNLVLFFLSLERFLIFLIMFSSLRLKLPIITFYEKINFFKELKVYYTPQKEFKSLENSGNS